MITPEQQQKIDAIKTSRGIQPKNATPTNEGSVSRVLSNARAKRATTEAAATKEANYNKPFLERAGSVIKDTYNDVKSEITGEGENANESPLRRGVEAVADTFGGATKLVKETIPSVNVRKGIDMVSDTVGDVIKKPVEALADTKFMKEAAEGYNAVDRGEAERGFEQVAPEILGTTAAGGEIAGTILGAEGALKTANVLKDTVKNVPKVIDKVQETRVANTRAKVDDAVGRIIQGKPEDIPAAKRALSDIDTKGVKDYKALTERLDDNSASLVARVDNELNADTRIFKKFNLARENKIKGIDGVEKIVHDAPVITALDELGEYYAKTGDVKNKTLIDQYKKALDEKGLRLKDVNDIARMHGRDLNAFNANGQLASGATKESIENTRSALKDVVRQNMPDDVTRALDSAIADTIRTRDLTQKMETNVNKLYQKIKNRTLAQKAGGAVADVVDLLTLGTLRGFIQKLLPSNVGLKTANSLDLEKELSKNLKKIEKLNAIEDPVKFSVALAEYMDEVQPGLSTRVKSGLTEAEKDVLLERLHKFDTTDVIKNDQVDLELFERLEELQKASQKSKGLTERQYAELKMLTDEMDSN